MQDFHSLCKLYNGIKINLIYGNKKIALDEILPDNFCPLAFHAIYPYMLTLVKKGWFNWVDYDEHVIVNCPSPCGIAMHVKSPSINSPNQIEAEVIKKNKNCYKSYEERYSIIFNFEKENIYKFKILDQLIPHLFNDDKNNSAQKEFFVDVDGEKNICCLEFVHKTTV